jgi:hypothetical protein
VLDESGEERLPDDSWKMIERSRRLFLADGVYTVELRVAGEIDQTIEPKVMGKRPDFVPFVFVNSGDLLPDPSEPPLIGLAQLAVAIYRLEADHRQALYLQAQDTLVVVGGGDEEIRVGANSVIRVPPHGDAKYIGVDSSGLPEMRQALENDYRRAARLGLGLLDTATRERESGEALKTRVASATASLTSIALAGAAGLETVLRMAARWVGANPEEVSVTPNLDFSGDVFDPKELADLMTARGLGAPLSLRTVHDYLREKDLTAKDFDEEIAEMADETEGDLGEEPSVE